jgi:type IV pilus assembly protein PilC
MSIKKKKVLSNLELSAFCQQIAMVVNAGLPVYYGVSILKDDAPDEETRALLEQIYIPMEAGQTLHDALDATGVFPDYMLHMIDLGEKTGRLEEVLNSLTDYYEREASIRASIRQAVTYPLVMTILMLAVIVVLIAKVLPAFAQVYEELGSGLTGFALTMMKISNVLNRYIIVFVVVFLVLLLAAYLLYRTRLGKILFQGGGLAMSVASGRFANCMHLALASGLDTDQGLDLAEKLVQNPHLAERIKSCRDHIRHGEGFGQALLGSGIFSGLYASWITIGFKTGAMDEVMARISRAYEEEAQSRLDRFISALEPTLVIILSVFIGLILISFLLPLLGIMSSIG